MTEKKIKCSNTGLYLSEGEFEVFQDAVFSTSFLDKCNKNTNKDEKMKTIYYTIEKKEDGWRTICAYTHEKKLLFELDTDEDIEDVAALQLWFNRNGFANILYLFEPL